MASPLRFVLGYAARYVPQYALGGAMLAATNWAVVQIPILMGRALDRLADGTGEPVRDARNLALQLAAWACALTAVRTLSRVFIFNPARDVEFRLRNDVFSRLLGLQRPFFATHKTGELVSLTMNDTMSVRLLVGFAGLQLLNVAAAVPLHLVQMARTDAWLSSICLVPIALGTAYGGWTVHRFHGLVRASMDELARLSERVLESYAASATIRAHAAETGIGRRFQTESERYTGLQVRIANLRAFAMPVIGLGGLVGIGLAVWLGGARVVAGSISVGSLAAFVALLGSLVGVLASLAFVLATLSRGTVALSRVRLLLDTPDGLPPARSTRAITAAPRLELRGLTFAYPGAEVPALVGVSAALEPGATLGIFGRTGSGKSTLVRLLCRLHTPPAGAIILDGEDVRDLPLSELRRIQAVAPQDAFLFSASLADNVRLAGEGAEDSRLREVVELVTLDDDLARMPEGLATVVGERGITLSGGQRQRVALARALYQRRPMLVLDDVLSAVDHVTEARLIRALRRPIGPDGPPTTVIVSHRTSALAHADRILVLDAGRVIEQGTHAELLAIGGHYAEAHARQRRSDA